MTAITSAYAHTYQATCLTTAVLRMKLPLAEAQSQISASSQHSYHKGDDFQGWSIFSDGGTHVVGGETFAGWCVIARSLHGRIDIMFGPVITTDAHPAFSGARTHSNNTAEMSAMIEALSFLGPRGPVARDVESCVYHDSKHAAGVSLGTIQARTHVQLALACQQSMLCTQHRLRLTMQHVYGHTGNLGNECSDHAAALGALGLVSNHNLATRSVRHNFDTSSCFDAFNNIGEVLEKCVALELKQHRYLRTGVSAVFLIGFFLFFTHACGLLSAPFPLAAFLLCSVVPQVKPWKARLRVSLLLRVLVEVSHITCGIRNWNCYFTCGLVMLSNPLSMNLTWLRLHSLVILLWIYTATKMVFAFLHDATSGTIARGVFIVVRHHCCS